MLEHRFEQVKKCTNDNVKFVCLLPCVWLWQWLHCILANYGWMKSNQISFALLLFHRILLICLFESKTVCVSIANALLMWNEWWIEPKCTPSTETKPSYSDEYILALKSTRSNQNQSDFGENNEINCEPKAHLLRRLKVAWCWSLCVCVHSAVNTHAHTQKNYEAANHSYIMNSPPFLSDKYANAAGPHFTSFSLGLCARVRVRVFSLLRIAQNYNWMNDEQTSDYTFTCKQHACMVYKIQDKQNLNEN